MSGLPTAIQAQLDQAAAIEAEVYGSPAPATAGNPEVHEPPPGAAVQQQPEPVQSAPVASPSSDWEQRFNVMRGKYEAEVPRLHHQIRELSERLEQALKAIETRQEPAPKPQDKKLVTDADVAAYGEDLLDFVRRVVREEFTSLIAPVVTDLDARYGGVVEQVTRTEQRLVKSDTEKFWDAVTAPNAAPDFLTVNEDPRWFAFLDTRAPGTSFSRRTLAEEAIKQMDALALIEQVAAFKQVVGEGTTPSATPDQKPSKTTKPSLSSQVSPSSSRATAPTQEASKRVWTSAEYAAAMDHRNLRNLTPEQYEAQIAEADLALAEGRVRG